MGCCSNARFLYFRCLSQLVSPNNFPHCIDKHPAETVEKLRFSDNLCFDFAKHGRPKVPMRKLSPSESMKTEVHAPGFHARCRAKTDFIDKPKHRT